jgi:flagellar export protein FliJ
MKKSNMRTLDILVKLTENQLIRLHASLNETALQKQNLEKSLSEMIKRTEEEHKSFIGTEYGFALDSYLALMEEKQKTLSQRISFLEKETQRLIKGLQLKFSELKKFEIVRAARIESALEEDKKLEVKTMDELGSSTFYNKNFS